MRVLFSSEMRTQATSPFSKLAKKQPKIVFRFFLKDCHVSICHSFGYFESECNTSLRFMNKLDLKSTKILWITTYTVISVWLQVLICDNEREEFLDGYPKMILFIFCFNRELSNFFSYFIFLFV